MKFLIVLAFILGAALISGLVCYITEPPPWGAILIGAMIGIPAGRLGFVVSEEFCSVPMRFPSKRNNGT